jgi:hypothetical protein
VVNIKNYSTYICNWEFCTFLLYTTLSTTNPKWTNLDANPGLCGERLATNHLNHSTPSCFIETLCCMTQDGTSDELRHQLTKAAVSFRLTSENPESCLLHTVCEEPLDLKLRTESPGSLTLRKTTSPCKRCVMSCLLWNELFGNSISESYLQF